MPRGMWRWVFNILSGLSLLLAVAFAVVWFRSYWTADDLVWFDGDNSPDPPYRVYRWVTSSMGGLRVSLWYQECTLRRWVQMRPFSCRVLEVTSALGVAITPQRIRTIAFRPTTR